MNHVSTNLDNLHDHPGASLLGSVLFFDGTLTDVPSLEFVGTFITLGLGVCCFLAWVESRWSKPRAVAVFLGGHITATLLTAVVVTVALQHGWYPAAVRQASDYGVSYGAQTVMAVGTLALPRRARLPWAAFVLAWPLGGAEWPGPLPDFTTVGHLIAAVLGFGLVAVPAFRRPRGQAPADRLAYTGADLRRIVEPGEITVLIGASSTDVRLRGAVNLTGPVRTVGHDRVLHTPVSAS